MPFLLWIVFPYSVFMGCCSLMLEQQEREPGA
jgi:hypothetical protein